MAQFNDHRKDLGYSPAFVDHWTDLIDWEKRRKGENGFLVKTLEKRHKCKKAFNACLGDGCDSIYLIKEGFDVTSNDLSLDFIRKAQENARRHNVKLDVTSHDWRSLDKHFDEDSFDAVLCLGNSLTHLFNKVDRLKAVEQFRRLLRKDGVLLIDERNYQYILDERDEIMKGNFRYSSKYVYCGSRVRGYPAKISDKKVVFEYRNYMDGGKYYLELYPFRRGEMLSLLRETGFSKITQYSDYKKGFNPRADFYTYVCVK